MELAAVGRGVVARARTRLDESYWRLISRIRRASARSKNTYLAAQYARPAKRRGKLRARKAVGHSILVACFPILAGGVPYAELGADYFEQRNSPERRARRLLNDLRALGWDITDTERGVICLPPPTAA